MAAVTAPPSPTSLQLRFGYGRRMPSYAFLRARLSAPPHRRTLLVLAAAPPEGRGRGQGQSWTGTANASPDSFSGWSDAEGVGGGNSRRNDRFGGILGAGLAGVFFVAGVTFLSLSLRGRTSSGVKQQMEPVAIEQEVLITSDDQDLEVGQSNNVCTLALEGSESKIIDGNSDCETGIDKDPFSSMGTNEDATQSSMDKIHCLETSSEQEDKLSGADKLSGDAAVNIQKASSQDNLDIVSNVKNIPLASSSDSNMPELSASEVVDISSAASRSQDTHSTTPYDTQDRVIEQTVDFSIVTPGDLSSPGTDPRIHMIDSQDGEFSVEIENFKAPLGFSSGFEGQLSSEPLSSCPLILESDNVVDSQSSINDVMEMANSNSKEHIIAQSDVLQLPNEASASLPVVHVTIKNVPTGTLSKSDIDQNEELTVPSESISSAPEGHKLGETGPSHSLPVLENSNGNEPDTNSLIQIDRSSLSDSLLPGKSFSSPGIPAPSLVSAASQVSPGKVLVPPAVDHVQGQALAALQVLKVIEAEVQPGDLCTRREYARWLVSASSALSRSTISKVYPAMYIENVTALAFDDVTPEDPDFPYIQGLAEAGLVASNLSRPDMNGSFSEQQDPVHFSPGSPLSRQDLVSWKMALERRQLPEVNRNHMYRCSGYIDIDKINPDAWPALVADLSTGDQSITALAFGYTRLFQPEKPVTKGQAAIALATGDAAEVVNEELTRIEAESLAESAVNAHTTLVAQVEKDLHASFEKELAKEREKIDALERLADEARVELERLRAERDEENSALIRGRAAVESEMEVLSKLRHEVDEQLQTLISDKMEISFEKDRINKLRKEAESENQLIVQLQYELEVERKALSMARAWAEDEAKRAREQARALEESRERWESQGIKVVVDEDLQDDASAGVTWITAGEQPQVEETINRAEKLVANLKAMAAEMKIKSSMVIEKIIQKIVSLISILKQQASEASKHAAELRNTLISKASKSIEEFQEKALGFSSNLGDRARRVVEDCKESVEKITHKFKA